MQCNCFLVSKLSMIFMYTCLMSRLCGIICFSLLHCACDMCATMIGFFTSSSLLSFLLLFLPTDPLITIIVGEQECRNHHLFEFMTSKICQRPGALWQILWNAVGCDDYWQKHLNSFLSTFHAYNMSQNVKFASASWVRSHRMCRMCFVDQWDFSLEVRHSFQWCHILILFFSKYTCMFNQYALQII